MTHRFTGWHMLGVMLAMFGTIIAVNVVMARFAIATFGGTVVDNSYVASQHYNRWLAQAHRQDQLGWSIAVTADAFHRPVFLLRSAAGSLAGASVSAIATHPLGRAPSQSIACRHGGDGRYVATRPLPAGRWLVRVEVRQGGRDAFFDAEVRA